MCSRASITLVKLGDGSSRTHTVEVIPRPTIVSCDASRFFPAYTGLPKTKRAPGDLTLLAGSTPAVQRHGQQTAQESERLLEGVDRPSH